MSFSVSTLVLLERASSENVKWSDLNWVGPEIHENSAFHGVYQSNSCHFFYTSKDFGSGLMIMLQ